MDLEHGNFHSTEQQLNSTSQQLKTVDLSGLSTEEIELLVKKLRKNFSRMVKFNQSNFDGNPEVEQKFVDLLKLTSNPSQGQTATMFSQVAEIYRNLEPLQTENMDDLSIIELIALPPERAERNS